MPLASVAGMEQGVPAMSSCQVTVVPGFLACIKTSLKIIVSTNNVADPTNVVIPGLRNTENAKKNEKKRKKHFSKKGSWVPKVRKTIADSNGKYQ